MHPTADTLLLIYLQRCGAAGDARVRQLSSRRAKNRVRVKELEPSVERAVAENLWLRLPLIFLAAPLLRLLLAYYFGRQTIPGWLVVAAAYAVALLVGDPPVRNDSRRRLEISRALVAWFSPWFRGGVLATPYLFLYLFLFDWENFFPR